MRKFNHNRNGDVHKVESWEEDGYLALLFSILQNKTVNESLKVKKFDSRENKDLSKIKRPRWKKTEIELLIKMIEDHCEIVRVAQKLGKTKTQVIQKKWELTRKGILTPWI